MDAYEVFLMNCNVNLLTNVPVKKIRRSVNI